MSNITKKTIHSQTQEYLDKNGLLYKYQSGFHEKFSTYSCLVQLTDFILRGMDKRFHTVMIIVDLQKVLDTLDHTVLLQKIECFQSYFSGSVFSVAGLINRCVPQESILGPLLLLIYVNDLPQTLNKIGSYLYADDTIIFYQDKDVKKQHNIVEYLGCYLDSNLNGQSFARNVLIK